MRKRRVRLFVDAEVLIHPHFSGIGHYTAELLRAIDTLLYRPEYSHVTVELGVPYMRKHRLAKYGFENFAIRGIPLPGSVIEQLKRRKRLPPLDLFFGRKVYLFPNYCTWPMMLSPSMPVIYDLSFLNHNGFVEPNNQKFLITQVALSAKRAKKIITISKNSLREIRDHYKYPEKDITIVYPAVELQNFYRRSADEITYVQAKYSIKGKYILFVGNIEPRKNLVTLLQAYKELPKAVQNEYGLLLIGAKGWLDDGIRDMIIEMRLAGLKIMQPTDYVVDEDLPALYSGSSAFVYISRYEGFGIPPIEAMACGVPAITSNNSSLPEAVGDAAVMVDAMDVKKVSAAIQHLLNDKDQAGKLVAEGYKQILKFNWMESAKALLEAAEELN